MSTFPIFDLGQSKAVAGWLSTLFIDNSPLRFSTETVNIPIGIQVPNDVHTGVRNSAVFGYTFIVPEGDLSFPLYADPSVAIQGINGSYSNAIIETVCGSVMKKAIQPYENSGDYPPTPPPIIAEGMTIYRGDLVKQITNPWANRITVDGTAGGRINVSVGVMATYGEYQEAVAPPPVLGDIREIMFNELPWDHGFLASLEALTTSGDTSFAPRRFTFTCNNNLIRDDSYNDVNPQSLRGFVFGMQEVTCEIDFLGGANPHRGGTEVAINGTTSPLLRDLTGSSFEIGGLFSLQNGVWSARVMNVPGNNDLAITTLTFTGMAPGDGSLFCVTPGTLLV